MLTQSNSNLQADLVLQDQLVEIRTLDDPAWGDPSAWPEWTAGSLGLSSARRRTAPAGVGPGGRGPGRS
jgi:hypothetical protein